MKASHFGGVAKQLIKEVGMLSIRKINPMARAIGTMGVVAGLVGVVTYAATVNANPVSLTNNDLEVGTASLVIGLTQNCSDGNHTSVQGMTVTDMVPGSTSSPYAFCIGNDGNIPLNLTAIIPSTVTATGTIDPNDVSLHFLCGVGGANTGAVDVTKTLVELQSAQTFGGSPLNNSTNNVYTCQVTAHLASSAVVSSGAKINPFSVQFNGTAGS